MIPKYLKYGIIFDIDDTLKVTQVLDNSKAVKNLFFREYRPVWGMPNLVRRLQTILASNYSAVSAGDTVDSSIAANSNLGSPPLNYYISGSVWQLIDPLKSFIDTYYARGELILQRFAMNPTTTMDLLDIPSYKTSRFTELQTRFPQIQWYLIGDSGQKDSETYAGIYNEFPSKVQCIWIVKTTGANEKKEAQRNSDSRFATAFHNVPTDRWFAFEDPAVLMTLPPGQCRP